MAEKEIIFPELLKLEREAFIEDRHTFSRIISVIGPINSNDYSPFTSIMKLYVKHQNDPLAGDFIRNFGVYGDQRGTKIFEHIIKDPSKYEHQFFASEALYLLTGEKVPFINSYKEKQDFFVRDELVAARQIIMESEGRKRTYKEMLALDKLYYNSKEI